MSRVIKFRVWHKNGNYMLPPSSIWKLNLFDDEDAQSGNWEVMQYTGFKDKNGKEIYEGDVINIPRRDFDHKRSKWVKNPTTVVVRDMVEFLKGYDFCVEETLLCMSEIEVLGNIYVHGDPKDCGYGEWGKNESA